MEILRSLKERCDPAHAALIAVDVQNDFVSPQGSAGKRGEDVSAAMAMIPNLTRLIDEARKIGLTVVYIRTTHSEWTDTPSWIYRSSQKSGLSTCREGTWGAEFYEGISPLPTERVVVKHRYSGFHNTNLELVLRNQSPAEIRRGVHGQLASHAVAALPKGGFSRMLLRMMGRMNPEQERLADSLLTPEMADVYLRTGWDAYEQFCQLAGFGKGHSLGIALRLRTGESLPPVPDFEVLLDFARRRLRADKVTSDE